MPAVAVFSALQWINADQNDAGWDTESTAYEQESASEADWDDGEWGADGTEEDA